MRDSYESSAEHRPWQVRPADWPAPGPCQDDIAHSGQPAATAAGPAAAPPRWAGLGLSPDPGPPAEPSGAAGLRPADWPAPDPVPSHVPADSDRPGRRAADWAASASYQDRPGGGAAPGGSLEQRPAGWVEQRPAGWVEQRPAGWVEQRPPGWVEQRPAGWVEQRPPGWVEQRPPGWVEQRPPGWVGHDPFPRPPTVSHQPSYPAYTMPFWRQGWADCDPYSGYPVWPGHPGSAARNAGLRRLSKLTWRAAEVSAVVAIGFVALFARTAHSATKQVSALHSAKPSIHAASTQPAHKKHKPKRHHHHHHHASPAGLAPPAAAPAPPPPPPPPPAAAPAPPPPPPPPPPATTSGGSGGGGG